MPDESNPVRGMETGIERSTSDPFTYLDRQKAKLDVVREMHANMRARSEMHLPSMKRSPARSESPLSDTRRLKFSWHGDRGDEAGLPSTGHKRSHTIKLEGKFLAKLANIHSAIPNTAAKRRLRRGSIDGSSWQSWSELFRMPDWRESKALVELIRSGVSSRVRARLWKVFLGSAELRARHTDGYYRNLVHLAEELIHNNKSEAADMFQIDKDLKRTLPKQPKFQSEEGIASLRRVLYAYALRNPDVVGYCQGMNMVCAGILNVIDDEEDAFWAFCRVVEDRVGYYTPTMCGLKVDQCVLNRLLSFRDPELYEHLKKLDVPVFTFTAPWFLCLLMDSPFGYKATIKFWDYLFCFGDVALFHVALEVLLLKRETMLKIDAQDKLLFYTLKNIGKSEGKSGPQELEGALLRLVPNLAQVKRKVDVLRNYFRVLTAHENRERSDCYALARRYGFQNPSEVQSIWEVFLAPAPWDILLTGCTTRVEWFADSVHRSCFPEEPESFAAHGLLSGFVQRLFAMVDKHGTKKINFKAFLEFVRVFRQGSKKERMAMCFRYFDTDGDGLVSFYEIARGIAQILPLFPDSQEDGDGGTKDATNTTSRSRKLAPDAKSDGGMRGVDARAAAVSRKMAEGAVELMMAMPSHIRSRTYKSGPFGLQIEVTPGAEYPVVTGLMSERAAKKGSQVGWCMLSVNSVSFRGKGLGEVARLMRESSFPATLLFHIVPYHHCAICDQRLANTGAGEEKFVCSQMCNEALRRASEAKRVETYAFPERLFGKVVFLNDATSAVFRLLEDSTLAKVRTARSRRPSTPSTQLSAAVEGAARSASASLRKDSFGDASDHGSDDGSPPGRKKHRRGKSSRLSEFFGKLLSKGKPKPAS